MFYGSQGSSTNRLHLLSLPFCFDCLCSTSTAYPFHPWLPQLPTAWESHTTHDAQQQCPLHVPKPGGQVSLSS